MFQAVFSNPSHAACRYPQVVSVVQQRGMYHAMVNGNHDPECGMTRRELVELDMRQPKSLTKDGPTALPGASNYWLVVGSSEDAQREALRIWMLDSEPVSCLRLRRIGRGCCEHRVPRWLVKVSHGP